MKNLNLEKMYRDMWNELGETGSACKSDTKVYKKHRNLLSRYNLCPACYAASLRTATNISICFNCPIVWSGKKNVFITCSQTGSLYQRWNNARNYIANNKRKKLALKIANLPWKE
jgi:hypothetical protein